MTSPAIFLTDNGSLRPEATFALRDLAKKLSQRVGHVVEPVSLLHSHKISADRLDGTPATIVKRRARELIKVGHTKFIILPLFLGPSLAISDYLPQVFEELKAECPDLRVSIADPLSGQDVDQPDGRLAEMLVSFVRVLGLEKTGARVALVDHGTPIRPVNRLRGAVAKQMESALGVPVQACAMERREGPEYAFNEPLLEGLGGIEGFSGAELILAMFFLLPGRHAGPSGDVAEIVDGLIERRVFERVRPTPLLSEHPMLVELLADRLMKLEAFQLI